MSKGSWQRPYDKKKWEENWNRIFKKVRDDDEDVELVTYGEYKEYDTEEEMVKDITKQVDYEEYETWRSGTEEEDNSGC